MSKYGHRTHNWFESIVNKLGGEERAESFLRGDLVVSEKILNSTEHLIEFHSTVVISARTKEFVARDNFIVDTSDKAKVKISYLNNDFNDNFLDKIEEPRKENTLCYGGLLKSSLDIPIIAEIGSEEQAETTLTEMFSLMEKQAKGETGDLLNDSYQNIFYIRDKIEVLWSVRVRWYDGGWYVNAYSVSCLREWGAGRRVFACNSLKS